MQESSSNARDGISDGTIMRDLQLRARGIITRYSDEEKKQLALDFVQEQLNRRQLFLHVFKTEKGSYYFMLASGECLRVRIRDVETIVDSSRMTFFIDQDQADKLDSVTRKNLNWKVDILDTIVQVHPCSLGMHPLELGDSKNSADFRWKDKTHIILGCENNERFYGNYHIGDKIVEIL